MLFKNKIKLLISCLLLLSASSALGSGNINAYPFDKHVRMTASFGEYRLYSGGKFRHEGIDLATKQGTAVYQGIEASRHRVS